MNMQRKSAAQRPVYERTRTVTFKDTNVVGNVYFSEFLAWQGECREMFLRDHAPEILEDLKHSLRLVTVRCDCSYHDEVEAFDIITLRMRLAGEGPSRLTLAFDYVRERNGVEQVVARGEQTIGCLRLDSTGLAVAAPVPEGLRAALAPYREVAS